MAFMSLGGLGFASAKHFCMTKWAQCGEKLYGLLRRRQSECSVVFPKINILIHFFSYSRGLISSHHSCMTLFIIFIFLDDFGILLPNFACQFSYPLPFFQTDTGEEKKRGSYWGPLNQENNPKGISFNCLYSPWQLEDLQRENMNSFLYKYFSHKMKNSCFLHSGKSVGESLETSSPYLRRGYRVRVVAQELGHLHCTC